MNIQREDAIRLVSGIILQMRRDYKFLEQEIKYVKAHLRYRTRTDGLNDEALKALSPVRRRAVERILGTEIKAVSISWLAKELNKNPDIYLEELKAEEKEILDFFHSEIFTCVFPEYDEDECERQFKENVKRYKTSQNRRSK